MISKTTGMASLFVIWSFFSLFLTTTSVQAQISRDSIINAVTNLTTNVVDNSIDATRGVTEVIDNTYRRAMKYNSTQPRYAENVILIIADDLGMEQLKLYQKYMPNGLETFPQTPVLDSLAKNGVLFSNFYTNPSCSPTRVSILTGRYGFRTGVGCPSGLGNSPGISENEITIPKSLKVAGVNSAIFGKWHMSLSTDGYDMPLRMGFDRYRGLFEGAIDDYYLWPKVEDGAKPRNVRNYATEEMADDTIEFLKANQTKPFFLWVAFNAVHLPLHKPPSEMLYTKSYMELEDINPLDESVYPIPYLHALIESMDYQIGRILDALEKEVRNKTTIIFMSDNGTDKEITAFVNKIPYDENHVKETVYEGGVRVPLIISGPGIKSPGRICDDLVNSVDIYKTITDLFGVNLTDTGFVNTVLETLKVKKPNVRDSISIIDVLQDPKAHSNRTFALVEQFGTCLNANFHLQEERAIRNDKYKYITEQMSGGEGFYNLKDDQYEYKNLVNQNGKIYSDLKANIRNEVVENYESLKEKLKELLATEKHEDEETDEKLAYGQNED